MTSQQQLLLDTCALIYFANGISVSLKAMVAVQAAARDGGIFVSPVSAWEIGLLSVSKRPVKFIPDPKTWFSRFLAQSGVRLAELTPEIAIDSSNLPPPIHGDPADRMLVATARALGVPIVTRDRLIQGYAELGNVQVINC
jgi:PIN domain nuclease of toxin-antitoxin system